MTATVVPKRRIPPKAKCDGAVPTGDGTYRYRINGCDRAPSVTVGAYRELHLCAVHAKAFGVGIPKAEQ